MNSITRKLNLLTNELAVTDEKLMEALLEKPEGIDMDLYLSMQAVLINQMRINHKEVKNMIKTVASRNTTEDIESLLIETKNEFDQTNDKESLVIKVFGKFMFAKGFVLLNHLNEVMRYKTAIETL